MADDLTPLPPWRQKLNAHRDRWRKSKNQRRQKWIAFGKMARKGLTLAFSVLGATLVAFGFYLMFAPAGLVVGGVLLWGLQWNYSNDGSSG